MKLPAGKPPVAVQPPQVRIREQNLPYTVRLAQPLSRPETFGDGGSMWLWQCKAESCTVSAPSAARANEVCRRIPARFGAVAGVTRGAEALTAGELKECNRVRQLAVRPPRPVADPAAVQRPASGNIARDAAKPVEAGPQPEPPTRSGVLPTEDVHMEFEPFEQDYQEQPKDRGSGQVPGRYPISDPDARLDALRVVRIDPGSGEIRSASPGDLWTSENSILVTLDYDLASAACAMVNAGFRTDEAAPYPYSYQRNEHIEEGECDPGNVPRGRGRVQKRLVLMCGRDSPDRIRDVRLYSEMILPTGRLPVTRLVQNEQPLAHTVLCRITGPGAVARLPDDDPPPSFEGQPAAARVDDQIKVPDRPVSPAAAARADDVVRPRAPVIDPGVARRPPPAKIHPGVAEGLGACTDPATVDLFPRLVGRTEPSRGVGIIEIVGVVRNIGRAAYVSDPRQQSVELIEEQPGISPKAVEDRTFTNLAPNATVRLVHRRSWDTSTEFQPRYRLRIVYEPDIRIDANPRNDDCGLANNEAVLEPERINALFR
ncbi:MAG: hypothetical protein ACREK5_02480 [Gemmatimonadota bacterium]